MSWLSKLFERERPPKVERLDIREGDIIVISYPMRIPDSMRAHIERFMPNMFPGIRILVLDQDATMKIVGAAHAEALARLTDADILGGLHHE